MKKLKQILIAIIHLAMLSGCSNKNPNSATPEEMPSIECVAIDLELPSGTLWAESNLGATSCEEPGYVFYWGDVDTFEPGKRYKYVNNCFYEGGGETKYLKYVTNEENGQVDGLRLLNQTDDAATAMVGDGWQIPTTDDIDELFEYCTQKFDICNNQEGITFVGSNGNSLFLPYHKRTNYIGATPIGEPVYDPIYWSKNLASQSKWEDSKFFDDRFACGIEIKTTFHTEEDKETTAEKGFDYRTTPGYIRPIHHK